MEKPTQAQLNYLTGLASRIDKPVPKVQTRREASDQIKRLKLLAETKQHRLPIPKPGLELQGWRKNRDWTNARDFAIVEEAMSKKRP